MAHPLARRSLLVAAPMLLAPTVRAQSVLPERGIRVMVGFQANGGTDIIARLIATQLQQRLGRHVVVENKAGESGSIPGDLLKKGSTDGSSLAFLASTTLVSRLGQRDFPFDPLVDLAPISLAGNWPLGLAVSPRLGISTFAEYLEWLKSGDAPDRYKLGNTASDAFIEVFNLMFSKALGITLKAATYRGAMPMVNDLAEGRVPAAVSGIVSLLQHHRGGRLKLLMTTGAKHLAGAKEIPTVRELGYPGLELEEWFAYFVKAGTAAAVIDAWNAQIRFVLDDRGLRAEVQAIGLDVQTSTPQEVAARIVEHQKAWKARMLSVGIEPVL
jgi:tripartite-type tricarboxylate transporter receptor subunit TctC